MSMDLSWKPRPALVFNNIRLSIQASEYAYCRPRQSGLPFDQYTHYEVGIIKDDVFIKPSDLGLPEYLDEGFYDVGAYIPYKNVEDIKHFLSLQVIPQIESKTIQMMTAPSTPALMAGKPKSKAKRIRKTK